MGAKTWMIVCGDGNVTEILQAKPPLDRAATTALVARLFPSDKLTPIDDGDLSNTNPPNEEIVAGCLNGLYVVAAKEFGIDYPSKLDARFLAAAGGKPLYLHAMHSVVDWFAYAIWRDGKLVRSLSVSPDSGVMEDLGEKRPFEEPYWAGKHPAVDPEDEDPESPYPLKFHPLELGEAALKDLFGYQLEGYVDQCPVQAEEIPLMQFKRSKLSKPFWKFW